MGMFYLTIGSIRPYTDPNLKEAYYVSTIDGKGTHLLIFLKIKDIIGRTNTH